MEGGARHVREAEQFRGGTQKHRTHYDHKKNIETHETPSNRLVDSSSKSVVRVGNTSHTLSPWRLHAGMQIC